MAAFVGLPLDRFNGTPLGPIDDATRDMVAPLVQTRGGSRELHRRLAAAGRFWCLLALLALPWTRVNARELKRLILGRACAPQRMSRIEDRERQRDRPRAERQRQHSDLGRDDDVIGMTREAIRPARHQRRARHGDDARRPIGARATPSPRARRICSAIYIAAARILSRRSARQQPVAIAEEPGDVHCDHEADSGARRLRTPPCASRRLRVAVGHDQLREALADCISEQRERDPARGRRERPASS